ncbi:lasso peptide biosynthesis PqqD family chaperone [Nostoc sp. UCD121]|uniref:lasso peptide biosynthesis PqqD family chaperone n=1 Tax=unclassified Nostoc TaxID=2593658 RepID=UPI00162A8D1F|nr:MULTISPECIES: lasso peptide biosynthesis PqqD family chaperone [unclassified Nostoc]MBC1224366.1 lasso peptide biosynthesis PqqD family chaperone [Nostoc sp. UCD120]MBC1279562.1 lasso peptide biosynthesis PqqD family chaperone [Nostoc sp. UCD121]MBC1296461.1 lasso peptide biosynthesis PqqD family chaperone [Nostoc sp. UCD122]
MVTGHSRVVVAKEQISSDLDGEAVILNLKSGVYYGLNPVGASIWSLIQQPKTISEIQDALLAQYEVESEQCDRDLFSMLHQLEAEGLIEVSDETAA